MSIEELERQYEEVMARARAAPMNPVRMDHDGHRWVEPVSSAWFRHSSEAAAIWDRLQRARQSVNPRA